MLTKKNIIGLLTSLVMACSVAQETQEATEANGAGRLELGIGLSYRHFDSVSIKSKNVGSGVLYEDKDMGAMSESAYYLMNVTGGHGDIDFKDCLAPAVTARYGLFKKDSLSVSAVAGFQYFSLDSKAKAYESTGIQSYFLPIRHPEFGSVYGGTDVTYDYARVKIEMDLYVFDLGLRGDYEITPKLSAYVAGGPSLNYSDMSAKVYGVTKKSKELTMGMYVEAGLEYYLRNNVSIVGDIRYDWAFNKPSAGMAEQDLKGLGAGVKLVYSF